MRSQHRARLRVAGGVLAALWISAPVAQGGEEPLPSPLIERQEVRFVSLDLVVSEKARGGWRPARGLRKEQVALLLGGQEVKLDSFEDWCREDSLRAGRQAGDAPLETGSSSSETVRPDAVPPESPEPIRYILYFDLTHLKHDGYRISFMAASKWAERTLRPHDEVMIVTGAAHLRLVRSLIPVGVGIREDLAVAERNYLHTEAWAAWEEGRIAEILRGEASAEAYAAMDLTRTRRSLRNLQLMMTLFENVEGTKNLVLFQDTIRLHPGSQYPASTDPSDVIPHLDRLAWAANERNVRFYPVQAGGLGAPLNDALFKLASDTGGAYIHNTNELGVAFRRVKEDSSCFYRVGFRLRSEFRGRTRRISVRIDGDANYRVRHRRTLHDPTTQERDTDRIRAALVRPETATAFPVEVSARTLFDHAGGARVRVQVGVAFQDLLALPSGEAEGEEIRQVQVQVGGVIVALRKTEGGSSTGSWSDVDVDRDGWNFGKTSLLNLPSRWLETHLDGSLFLNQEIHVPPGDYRLVAVVQDRLTQVVAAGITEFSVRHEPEVLSDIHLAVIDPFAVPLESMEPEEHSTKDLKERRKGVRILPLPASLPAWTRLAPAARLDAPYQGLLVYGFCNPEAPANRKTEARLGGEIFGGWKLEKALTCGQQGSPIPLAAQRLPSPGFEDNCVLVIDPIPPDSVESGPCRFNLTLTRPDADPLSRRLDFEVGALRDLGDPNTLR